MRHCLWCLSAVVWLQLSSIDTRFLIKHCGWGSLTPAFHLVVMFWSDGLLLITRHFSHPGSHFAGILQVELVLTGNMICNPVFSGVLLDLQTGSAFKDCPMNFNRLSSLLLHSGSLSDEFQLALFFVAAVWLFSFAVGFPQHRWVESFEFGSLETHEVKLSVGVFYAVSLMHSGVRDCSWPYQLLFQLVFP